MSGPEGRSVGRGLFGVGRHRNEILGGGFLGGAVLFFV